MRGRRLLLGSILAATIALATPQAFAQGTVDRLYVFDCGHNAAADHGDAAHFNYNWENRRVTSMNASAEQTQASYRRIANLIADKKAEFWIDHDKPQSTSQKRSPQYYE